MGQSIGRFTSVLALVLGVGTGAGVGASLVAPGVASAATTTFTVNDAGDFALADSSGTTSASTNAPDESPTCTLRAAIQASTNVGGDTTINLPDPTTLGSLSASAYVLDDAGLGQLQIDDTSGTVTIAGAGSDLVTIEAATSPGTATTRVLKVDPNAAADISGVTIANGDSSNSGETAGGLLNCATLTLSNSVVTNNQTNAGPGGGIYTESAANTTLDSDTVIGNSGSDGGGIYGDGGTMSLTDVVVSGNTATTGDGGGVYTVGTNLTITDGTIGGTGSGVSETSGNTAASGSGGGLAFFGGTVILSGVTIGGIDTTQGNTAQNGGGVFDSVEDPSFTGDTIEHNTADNGDGGGVFVANGTSTFTNETIEDNLAVFDDTNGGDGGGVYISSGSNTFSGGTISNNTSDDGDDGDGGGGGVYILGGTNSFSDGTVAANSVTDGGFAGGGFYVTNGSNTFSNETIGGAAPEDGNTVTDGGDGGGGYIDGGTNSFTGGSASNNLVSGAGQGGGFYIDDGTNTFTNQSVTSNQATGGGEGGGFYIDGGTANTFTGETVNSNAAVWDSEAGGGQGGGFYVDFAPNSFTGGSISNNRAYEGGGAYLDFGVSTFAQSTISGNTATEAGGGFWVSTEDPTQVTTITQSTISGNNVTGLVGTSGFLGDGGGILSGGCNQMTLTNDTIASNTAPNMGGGYFGIGCGSLPVFRTDTGSTPHRTGASPRKVTPHIETSGRTSFQFDTMAGNTQGNSVGGGNIVTTDASTLTMANSIVAYGVVNTSPTTNCDFTGSGTLTSGGYNLVDDSTCGTPAGTDIIGKDPQLGPLGNNGGPTQTELPANASPAVGAVPDAVWVATGVGADRARGRPRGGRQLDRDHRGGRGGPELQRLPHGGQRGRHLRLRAALQRLFGQQPPQRPHRGHRQLAGPERVPHGRR